ncbi:hypothetical protein GQ457_07G005590 [Hibiscus cannabinus]
MTQSIDKPPYFNGTNYSYWKNNMMLFMQSIDYKLSKIIDDVSTIPKKLVGDILVPKERHEWNDQERKLETKIRILNLSYKNFKMDPNEDIKALFDRFSIILIYSLPDSWDSKKMTIIEARNLKELKLDELMRSLHTHEIMMSKGKEKKEEQDIEDLNVALKSSTSHQEYSTGEDSNE